MAPFLINYYFFKMNEKDNEYNLSLSSKTFLNFKDDFTEINKNIILFEMPLELVNQLENEKRFIIKCKEK